MQKHLIALSIALAFSASAGATAPKPATPSTVNQGGQGGSSNQGQGQGQDQTQGQGQGQNQGQGQTATGGKATAGAVSGAVAGAVSGSSSKSGSTSKASTGPVSVDASSRSTTTTSVGQSSSQSMTINEAAPPAKTTVEHTGTSTVRTTPDVYAPGMVTTAVCVIGQSGGASGLGWGFSIGGGVKDEGCEIRALSSLLHSQGAPLAAKELLCAADARVHAAYAAAGMPCISAVTERKAPLPPAYQ